MAEPVTTLEAGGLPSDWQKFPFEQCILEGGIERKASIPQSDYRRSGRFPVVDQGSSLIAGYTEDESLVHRDDLPLILFGDHTRIFKFLDFPFATGADGTKLFRANKEAVDPKFLYYALLHIDIPSRGYNRHFKYLKEKRIQAPLQLPEQRAIAAVLSKIQEAVEVQGKIVATLKELKAATMAKLFREGLRGEPLKQTEIGEIPVSWEVVQLGEVARIERGKFAHRPRNEPRFYGGDIPFIQTGDVTKSNGRIRTYTQTLNEEGLKISRIFPRGTIVLTIAANIGDTAILEFDSAFPDSLVGITPSNGMDSVFLEYYLRTQKPEMDRLAPKGTQKNINIQFLKPWPTPLPPLDEQREIARHLRNLDDKLETAAQRSARLKSLFSSMLHLLMTGQVRANDTTMSKAAV